MNIKKRVFLPQKTTNIYSIRSYRWSLELKNMILHQKDELNEKSDSLNFQKITHDIKTSSSIIKMVNKINSLRNLLILKISFNKHQHL